MPDPVAVTVLAGAAGGVAGEFIKQLWSLAQTRWLATKFAAHLPEAQAKAMANTSAFLISLAERLSALEQQNSDQTAPTAAALGQALEDPDTALTLQAATLAAARTSTEEKRRLLVETVVTRLQAPSDSAKAIATNLAVEVIPSLGAEHLDALGLMGLLLAAVDRFKSFPPSAYDRKSTEAEVEGKERATTFIDWFRTVLGHHKVPDHLSDAVLIHLGAIGVCVLGPRRSGDLADALSPPPQSGGYLLVNLVHGELGKLSFVPPYKTLNTLWGLSLSRLTPTPVGTVIGMAIHDIRTGDTALQKWHWGGGEVTLLDYPDNEQTFGDKAFNDAVVRAVGDQIRRETRRGY
jgi:hypothetical protein